MSARFATVGVVAVLSLLACATTSEAGLIWSEDFNSHPDLSSGNWHWNITQPPVVTTAGTWDTSSGAAVSNNSGAGVVQSSAQYVFTSAEKSAFGSLYDSGTGLIGGGSVAGTLYIRFDGGLITSHGLNQFAFFQTQRGSTTNCADLDPGAGLDVGNGWGSDAYLALVNITASRADFTAGPLNQSLHTFIMKINYVAGAGESATMWFDPTEGVNEAGQSGIVRSSGAGNLAFDTFVLRVGNNNSNWRFDNVKFGTAFSDVFAVPEPASMTLLAFGLAGFAGFIRRRRKA